MNKTSDQMPYTKVKSTIYFKIKVVKFYNLIKIYYNFMG